jgi:hypothetical protein
VKVKNGESTEGRDGTKKIATFPLPERVMCFCVYALSQEIVHSGKSKDRHDIETVLTILSKDYAMSAQSNFRKGGLIGLAAASLGLGSASQTKTPGFDTMLARRCTTWPRCPVPRSSAPSTEFSRAWRDSAATSMLG